MAGASHARALPIDLRGRAVRMVAETRPNYRPSAGREHRAVPGERDLEGGVGFLRSRARPTVDVLVALIDTHRQMFSTERVGRLPCPDRAWTEDRDTHLLRHQETHAGTWSLRDTEAKTQIRRIHTENFSVTDVRKAWHRPHHGGIRAARCVIAWPLPSASRRSSPSTPTSASIRAPPPQARDQRRNAPSIDDRHVALPLWAQGQVLQASKACRSRHKTHHGGDGRISTRSGPTDHATAATVPCSDRWDIAVDSTSCALTRRLE